MAAIHIDEKWLAEHPQGAGRIRQAEGQEFIKGSAVQESPPAPGKDVPGRPESDDRYMPIRLNLPRRRPFWWLLAAFGILFVLIMGAEALTHSAPRRQAPQVAQAPAVVAQYGRTAPVVAAMQGDLNRVIGTTLKQDGDFGPATLSALQAYERKAGLMQTKDLNQGTWSALQTAANHVAVKPAPQKQTVAKPVAKPVVKREATKPVSSAGTTAETVQQWINSPAGAGSGVTFSFTDHAVNGVLTMESNKAAKTTVTLCGNGHVLYSQTFIGPEEHQEQEALFNMPVAAVLNQSRPPITGQMVGNGLPVTLEVSGPAGVKTVQGKIDSGSQLTEFPASFLQSLGYSPVNSQTVEGVTGTATEGVYDIPDILVKGNDGQWEILSQNTKVWGTQFPEALIGADILQHCSLSIIGTAFVLGFTQ